jgi:hypothetical protein
MTRMILSLEDQDKSWLERKAREEGVSMAEVVRQAVRRMQHAEEESLDQVLAATRGLWRKGDGLRYQRAVRREWK